MDSHSETTCFSLPDMSQKVFESEFIERREPWISPRTVPCLSADPVPPAGNPRVAPDSDHATDRPCASWPRAPHRNTSRGPKVIAPLILLVVPRHAGLDLLQVGVLAVHQDDAQDPSIPVVLAVVHLDGLAGDKI